MDGNSFDRAPKSREAKLSVGIFDGFFFFFSRSWTRFSLQTSCAPFPFYCLLRIRLTPPPFRHVSFFPSFGAAFRWNQYLQMTAYEHDPDIVRWGLHQLLDVCSLSTGGSRGTCTRYDQDLSRVEYVREGYCDNVSVENDEVIARALQEELARLTASETSGSSQTGEVHEQASILAQDWHGPSDQFGFESCHREEGEREQYSRCSSSGDKSVDCEDGPYPEISDESTLDGEVGKRLNQMVPIAHVPKVNGEIPTTDEEISDHERLMGRLQLYDLVELKVSGDGNCQFRSLSDQIYRSPEHHKSVREQIINQLKSHPELYEGYVPMAYDEYLKKMSKTGEWGDHVTLQTAADSFGIKIFVITSFKDTCYIEILPCVKKSNRIIFLSFWAEVHYNSIYPVRDLPKKETRDKKKWWMLGG